MNRSSVHGRRATGESSCSRVAMLPVNLGRWCIVTIPTQQPLLSYFLLLRTGMTSVYKIQSNSGLLSKLTALPHTVSWNEKYQISVVYNINRRL